jgi:hypothetical protein
MDEGIIPAVDCSNTSETGEPLFPKKRVLFSLNNGALQVNVPCERVHNKSVVIGDPEECPPPTIHNHYHYKYPKCTPPCLIFFTETQRNGIVILGYVLTFINLITDVFLLVVFFKIQEFRKVGVLSFYLPYKLSQPPLYSFLGLFFLTSLSLP